MDLRAPERPIGSYHKTPDAPDATSFFAVNVSRYATDLALGYGYRTGTYATRYVYIAGGRFERSEEYLFTADRPEISGTFDGGWDAAELKILVFGDSYTAMQPGNDGMTWPLLLQHRLERELGKRVRVANFARFGHGVLQMADLAARTVPQWRPHLFIIAYITNDLIRRRWWLVDRMLRGRHRLLTTMSPNPFPDPLAHHDAADFEQIDPHITAQWCEDMTAAKRAGDAARLEDDERVRNLCRDRAVLEAENAGPREKPIGAVAFDRLDEDPGFRTSIARLGQTEIPGALVHLPHASELEKGSEFFYEGPSGIPQAQGAALRDSLERALRTETIGLLAHMSPMRCDPAAYMLTATNPHPNRRGLDLLAEAAASALLERGAL